MVASAASTALPASRRRYRALVLGVLHLVPVSPALRSLLVGRLLRLLKQFLRQVRQLLG